MGSGCARNVVKKERFDWHIYVRISAGYHTFIPTMAFRRTVAVSCMISASVYAGIASLCCFHRTQRGSMTYYHFSRCHSEQTCLRQNLFHATESFPGLYFNAGRTEEAGNEAALGYRSLSALISSTVLYLSQQVGYKAVDDHVKSGMVIGLGTGSTAYFAVERVGQKLKSGELKNIICIPTSERTKEQALSLGIPLVTLNEKSKLDVAIDGADDVDRGLNLIKGGGGWSCYFFCPTILQSALEVQQNCYLPS